MNPYADGNRTAYGGAIGSGGVSFANSSSSVQIQPYLPEPSKLQRGTQARGLPMAIPLEAPEPPHTHPSHPAHPRKRTHRPLPMLIHGHHLLV